MTGLFSLVAKMQDKCLFLPPSFLQNNVLSDTLCYSNGSADTRTLRCSRRGVYLSAGCSPCWQQGCRGGNFTKDRTRITTLRLHHYGIPLAIGTSSALIQGTKTNERSQRLLWVVLLTSFKHHILSFLRWCNACTTPNKGGVLCPFPPLEHWHSEAAVCLTATESVQRC